jgi:hypothetical protein
MGDERGAQAREAAFRDAVARSAQLKATSEELVALSRELRARIAEMKGRLPSRNEPPRGAGDR